MKSNFHLIRGAGVTCPSSERLAPAKCTIPLRAYMYDICIFRTERDEKREGRRVTRPVKISKMFRPLFTSSSPRYAVVVVHFFDRARKKSRPFAFCSFLRSIMPVSRYIPGCSSFDWCLCFLYFFRKLRAVLREW